MKKLFALLIIFLNIFLTYGQEKPYFQQRVNYKINAKYYPSKQILRAHETITYHNQSPDTLYFIYFHIWANAYKNPHTPYGKQTVKNEQLLFHFLPDSQRGYCDSLHFMVNGKKVKITTIDKYGEIVKLNLNKPLLPGDSIIINTPFKVKMPLLTSRMGIWQNNKLIAFTQWYPKPAVYDRFGWHYFPYLDMGEFYSEYGSFDVTISVPQPYIVAATGNLLSRQEYNIYKQMAKDASKGKTPKYPVSCSTCYKTLHYTEHNIHDFAWFISQEFVPRTDTLHLKNGHIVEIWTFDPRKYDDYWKDTFLKYAKRSVKYLSEWNYPYPYNTCKVVFGGTTGGGMEYPTITIIDAPPLPSENYKPDSASYDEVICHEIGHNWFYGILGFNEREHPFMDEGINTSNQYRYMLKMYSGKNLFIDTYGIPFLARKLHNYNYIESNMLISNLITAFGSNIPINSSSTQFSPVSYFLEVYNKTAYLFSQLRNYLGDSLYDASMHNLFKEKAYTHPYPEDIKQSFEKTTGMDLSWFFDDMLNTPYAQDYKLKKIKNKDTISVFVIKKKEEISSPVSIGKFYNNGFKIQVPTETALTAHKQVITFSMKLPVFLQSYAQKLQKYYIYPGFAEMPWANNNYYPHKLFKRKAPLKIEPLFSVQDPDHRYLNYFPLLFYGTDKGMLAGIALYNSSLFFKKWQFLLIPFTNLSKGTFMSGYGKLDRYFFTRKIKNITYLRLRLTASSFRMPYSHNFNFQKYNVQIAVKIKNKYRFAKQYVMIKNNNIYTTDLLSYLLDTIKMSYYNITSTEYTNFNPLTPIYAKIDIENGKNYSKIYGSADLYWRYDKHKHYIALHLFGGTFLYNKTNNPLLNFRLNGITPFTDYTYSQWFISKNSRTQHGSIFAYPSPFQSPHNIVSSTVEASSPLRLISAYFSISKLPEYDNIFYEAGINFNIWKDAIHLTIPLITSDNIHQTLTKNIYLSVFFDINKLDPFRNYEEAMTVRF